MKILSKSVDIEEMRNVMIRLNFFLLLLSSKKCYITALKVTKASEMRLKVCLHFAFWWSFVAALTSVFIEKIFHVKKCVTRAQ
jgi:hypothetical protein